MYEGWTEGTRTDLVGMFCILTGDTGSTIGSTESHPPSSLSFSLGSGSGHADKSIESRPPSSLLSLSRVDTDSIEETLNVLEAECLWMG